MSVWLLNPSIPVHVAEKPYPNLLERCTAGTVQVDETPVYGPPVTA
jgi:hypothetical protein